MRFSKIFITVIALGAGLSAAAPAHAQSAGPAAVALFEEGRAAMGTHDYDLACSKFRESNRLDPAIGTAFNLANCEELRGRLATAWALFKDAASRMKPDDARLPVAQQRIASLDHRVPRLVFVADARINPRTRVRVDALELDRASFDSPLPLDPGPHEAVVREPGAEPRTTAFRLAAGETVTLPLSAPAPARQPDSDADRAGDDRILGMKRHDALLAAGAVGIAGLLVGTIAGVIGLNAQAVGDADCSTRTRTCSQAGYDANQRAKSLATVSSIGFVVGILGAGAATYLYVTLPNGANGREAASLGVGGTW